ncbi:unnamed protein product [Porites lobata]|uniref:Uncharacterized protein n=1 Tax=Porites lobata TaxID=104759 RepID=A0ABN8NQK4_9CNID|nr:unnamed protein product [Porites lobata]
MLDFNNSLVVVSFFLVLIARESRVKFLVKTMAPSRSQYIPLDQHNFPLGYIMTQERPVPAAVSWQEGNMTELQLEILFGGMGYEGQNVRQNVRIV